MRTPFRWHASLPERVYRNDIRRDYCRKPDICARIRVLRPCPSGLDRDTSNLPDGRVPIGLAGKTLPSSRRVRLQFARYRLQHHVLPTWPGLCTDGDSPASQLYSLLDQPAKRGRRAFARSPAHSELRSHLFMRIPCAGGERMNKRLKYRLLRRMPGALGRRYARKYSILLDRTEGFAEALRRSRGMTCIDLGANLGKHTRQMATTVRQVIAFEPDPWAFSALRSNVADLENVRLENLAAGTSNGIVPLYRHLRFDSNPDAYSQSSTVVSGKFNVSTEGAVAVRQVDFLQYLEECRPRPSRLYETLAPRSSACRFPV